MSSEQAARNKATLMRFNEALNSRDPEVISKAIDETVQPDAQIYAPAPIDATGAELLKELFRRLHAGFPDIEITVEDVVAEGDKVACRNSVTGTHLGEYMGIPATGKTITYNEHFIVRFVDGRMAESRGVVDMLSQLRQLGAIAA